MSLQPLKITAIAKTDSGGSNVIPNAAVSIVDGAGGYPQLWLDQSGTTPESNPFTCDSNGEALVYIEGGYYSVAVGGGQSWDVDLSSAVEEKDNYAAVRALSGYVAFSQVSVAGHTARGDGGGGTFYYDSGDVSSADNGVTILVDASGRRWKRIFNGPLRARWAGAKGDGVTDDLASCQAALAVGDLDLGDGNFRLSGELSSNGRSISGSGPDRTIFTLDLGVSIGIRVTGGSDVTLKGFRVTRAAGAVGASTVGIQWDDWNYGREENLVSDRHGYCWNYEGPAGTTAIGHKGSKLHAHSAVTSYVRVNNIADLYWDQCECGTNAGDAYAPVNCLILSGLCNAINFTDTVFIPRHASASSTTIAINYNGMTNATGVFSFLNCNVENVKHIFTSDATTTLINEFKIIGGRWTNDPGQAIFLMDSATSFGFSELLGANFGNGSVLIKNMRGRVESCSFQDTTIDGGAGAAPQSTLSFVGNNVIGSFAMTGAWYGLSMAGNIFDGGYTDTATGNVSQFDNTKVRSSTTGGGTRLSSQNGATFAFGQAAPVSLLTVKQITDNDAGGLVLVAPNSTNYWAIRTGSDNKLYFSYNGTTRGSINETTGAYTAFP